MPAASHQLQTGTESRGLCCAGTESRTSPGDPNYIQLMIEFRLLPHQRDDFHFPIVSLSNLSNLTHTAYNRHLHYLQVGRPISRFCAQLPGALPGAPYHRQVICLYSLIGVV